MAPQLQSSTFCGWYILITCHAILEPYLFRIAIHHHFSQKFLSHQQTTGEKHPDFWTLSYMSKVICT